MYAMFGYDASSSTLAPQRYAAGDRGPIEGLIRAKSKVLRGTIILGFVHPGGIFLVSPPPALKRSCLAVTCFAMNVINCNQTCTGEKVVFACCWEKKNKSCSAKVRSLFGMDHCL